MNTDQAEPPSDDIVIRFQNISKSFRKERALDQIGFDVPKGVVFAMLGENGARTADEFVLPTPAKDKANSNDNPEE